METEKSTRAFQVGALLQGGILGVLLAIAIVEIIVLTSGVQLFKYQGF